MAAERRFRHELLAFGTAFLLGLVLSRCGQEQGPGAGTNTSGGQLTCQPGDASCVCSQQSNGTLACSQGSCDASHVCGKLCCAYGEVCDNKQCVTASNQCVYVPGPNEFEPPQVVWWWPFTDATGKTLRTIDEPTFVQVMSTPAVVRLHGAAHPEEPPAVIFNTFVEGGSPNVEGVLRAIRGDDGSPIFTVTDKALRTNGVSSIAVGDLDGDGNVEIVTGAFDTTGPSGAQGGLIAFRSDGSLYWKSEPLFVGWGGPAIADLDGNGKPEVIIGNTVLEGTTGKELCNGGWTGIGDNNAGPLSTVADIDGDGLPEILTGDMAYKLVKDATGTYQCRHLWPDVIKVPSGNQLLQGFTAVAQIYNDPSIPVTINKPDVAVVSKGTLRVQDWTGGLLMNPVMLPGGGFGGPPTIADFDGDGKPEIGVAGQSHYTVFKPGRPGGVLWTVQTQDVSSSVTGSSVFDFDGNGVAEVIYNDECYMRVFNGKDGSVEFQAPNSSCTAYEMPVIADVDGTGAAGLLVPSNKVCSITCPWGTHAQNGMYGLRLFKSPSDSWVASRPVWNEHSYHLTNVGDDGEIPSPEPRFWGPNTLNSFRQNYQGKGTFNAPDLTVTKVWVDGTNCPNALTMSAEVANLGSRGVRQGLDVTFYEQTPNGNQVLGVAQVGQPLLPGQTATVSIDWKGPPRLNPATVTVVVDDDGTGRPQHKECNLNNNSMVLQEVICRDAG